jgi:hypothetical protein
LALGERVIWGAVEGVGGMLKMQVAFSIAGDELPSMDEREAGAG